MDFTVVTTVIAAIFRNIDHAFHSTVKRSVKNTFLAFSPSFYLNFPKLVCPNLMTLFFYRFKTFVICLFLKVHGSLMPVNVRDSYTDLNRVFN